jgi:DNA-binding LacI/PurR family transcriptional regulator
MATLIDIARETNTSVSTVSRVLAGGAVSKRISRETRERVSAAARRMGYRPNLLARSLRTRKTNTIALMVEDIANPFFGQIASLVEVKLHAHGYSLMLCNTGFDPAHEAEYLQLVPQKGIDGLIIVPISTTKTALDEALPPGMPLVVLDRPVAGISACVSTDQDALCNQLYDRLEKSGVKTVCVIAGPQIIYNHKRRAELAAKRFKVLMTHFGEAQRETGMEAVSRFYAVKPDAIIATNNILCQGFIESYGFGGELPLLGTFDEIPMQNFLPAPIACAAQDVPRLAEGTVQLMLELLAEPGKKTEPVLIPCRVTTNDAFEARVGRK